MFYIMPDGTTYQHRAWTGGDSAPAGFCHEHFVKIMFHLYCNQVHAFAEYWREAPNADTAGIFWQRAKCDAWRTFSNGPHKLIQGPRHPIILLSAK